MIASSAFLSLLLFGIVLIGAKKVFDALVKVFSSPFKQVPIARVRRSAFIIVGMSIGVMAAPLLIPFGGPMRLLVMVVYMIYVGSGLMQVWSWFSGSKPDGK
ncbi:MAG TPA: hypothetical protein PKN86_08105 [Candidatus Obscuribacter sp.]|nr:hypothetical protein [Candidatus Obscuribacter sp.]MBK9280301.1 hypothetical protein [Candidatus Obscuribacter sp.]HNH74502.1 hypothetical protein [Candidatus Obscuribacter sp.]HNM49650.1 hypothetical protein [Candidatus Obscuribacter sp.]